MPAMTTVIAYACPAIPPEPNRWVGWPLSLLSFAVSMLVATAAIGQGYSLHHYSGCGFGYGMLQNWFYFFDPVLEAFAILCWVGCLQVGAGMLLCRIGVEVAAVAWFGSWLHPW